MAGPVSPEHRSRRVTAPGCRSGRPGPVAGLVGLLLALLGLLSPPAPSAGTEPFPARVLQGLDGDSLIVLRAGRRVEVRLQGIDAPEGSQPFGRQARGLARRLAGDLPVTLGPRGEDQHGRLLAEVVLPDGRSLNREMVRAGLAWWFRRFSDDTSLGELETEARAARRGLWAQDHPIPPWEWRDAHRVPASPGGIPAPVVANRRSGIYHRADCPGYPSVAASNRVPFASPEAAEAAGYRVARDCPLR